MGVAHALLKRLNEQRLPFLLRVEERVKAGERLTDTELEHLQAALKDAQSSESVVAELEDEFPGLEGLVSRVVDLYHSIASKALENEERTDDA